MKINIKKLFIYILLTIPIITVKADNIDTSIKGSINIHYEYENNKINNINIKIYNIADINNNLEYIFKDDYKDVEKNIKKMSSSELGVYAKELEDYINNNNLTYDSTNITNEEGIALFNNLNVGIYLLTYEEKIINNKKYNVNPTIINIPSINEKNNTYNYNLDIYSKVETTTISTNNDKSNIVDNNINNNSSNKKERKGIIENIFKNPKTGDSIIVFVILLFISLIGIISVVLYEKRSRKKEIKNEENK